MIFFAIGIGLLAVILGLFWLKDRLRNPMLARVAYSEPIARLAVIGAALSFIGSLMMMAKLFRG